MRNNRKIKAITFSGISIALIVIFLFMASIIEVLDYSICLLCGLAVALILAEFGTSSALSVFVGSSILSLMMVPSKISVVLFVAFCGWYPLAKKYLEKFREPFGTISKYVIFNITLTIMILLFKELMIADFPQSLPYCVIVAILYVAANVIFGLFDTLITRLTWLYLHKYRKQFNFFK